jgi:hypothetical protein
MMKKPLRKTLQHTGYVLLLIACLSASLPVFSQSPFIVAGFTTQGDTVTDLIPDSVMQCLAAHLSPYPTQTDTFDLDHDGQSDIFFKTYGNGGLGGGSAGCLVYAAGNHASIAVRTDTVVICCPQNMPLTVADTFNAGDTIDGRLRYSPDGWIMSESYGGSTAPYFDRWTNIGPKYIGIRLALSFDTLYGWIKVAATQNGALTVNRNTHIGIPEQELATIKVYPTASYAMHRIWLPPDLPQVEYSVKDLTGRLVNTGVLSSGDNTIDSSRWRSGTYLLILTRGIYQRTFRLIRE